MDLFPAFPDELGRECLLRVPYTSHNNLAAVCRSWEATVKNPQFYHDRKTIGVSQQCICLMEVRHYRDYCIRAISNAEFVITVYDPQQGTWETLPRVPHFPGHYHGMPFNCRCVGVNGKLLLIGGLNVDKAVHTVFIYDFSSARWSRGADMAPVGIYFACSVSPEGLVYVAGGTGNDQEALRTAAVYNVEQDEWKLLPDMNRARHNGFGAFIDAKFCVLGGYCADVDGFDRNAEVYDPETGAWTTLQNMWTLPVVEARPRFGRTVSSSDGRFYCFQKQQEVKEYDSKENVWRAVGSLPQTLGIITFCASWRDMIFVNSDVRGIGNDSRNNVFYMLKPPPPPIRCGAEFHGEWVAVPILRPQPSHVNYDQNLVSVVTVEI